MASALLASSRDEPFWTEPKAYARKNPCPNPNPNLNPTLASDNRSKDRPRQAPATQPYLDRGGDPSSSCYDAHPAASDDSSSLGRRKTTGKHRRDGPSGRKDYGFFESTYVTFDIGSYSRRELQQLKRRLISELEQVRSLGSRIDAGEVQPARSACFSTTGHGGGSGGGREVTSAPAGESPKSGGGFGERNSFGKRPLTSVSSRDGKRSSSGDGGKTQPAMMKKCAQILTKLMRHRHGWVFNAPVDVLGLGLHDYYQIVRRPMDLGTVKSKLVDRSGYGSPLEFAADVRLTFNNALLYNPEGHDVHKMAGQLLNLFEKLFADACRAYESRAEEEEAKPRSRPAASEAKNRHSLPRVNSQTVQPQSRPPPASPSSSPVALKPEAGTVAREVVTTGKQAKPKAKEMNKREMSFEEKKKLSQGLQSLPEEKMAQVLLIVQRRNPDPALHGDEIELDFETLDTETLWELDRFVANCKKMLSKVRRQEAVLPAPEPMLPQETKIVTTAAAAAVEEDGMPGRRPGKKGGEVVGEEDVDIGEEVPSTQFSPVEIDKDSGNQTETSSSSSSSGSDSSSSSDSESRSSGESDDSDADDAQSPAVGLT